MNDAHRVDRLARLLIQDGHVDNEVDARLAAVRIIAASDAIWGKEREAQPAEGSGRTDPGSRGRCRTAERRTASPRGGGA